MATAQQIQMALQRAQAAGNTADVEALQNALSQATEGASNTGPVQQGPSREQLSQAFYAAQQAGNTDDARQIMGYVQQHGMTIAPMNPAQQQAATQQANQQAFDSYTGPQKFEVGLGKSFMDTGRGIGQLVGAIPSQQIAQDRQQDAPIMTSGAGMAGDLAGQGAQMLAAGGALGTGAKLAGLAGRAIPYVTSALAGGAFNDAQPVTGNESRGLNALAGATMGAAGEALPGILVAAANKAAPAMSAAKQAALDTAERYGIPLHLSQVAGGRFTKTLGAAAKYLPFSGSQAADDAQRMAFNRALSSTIGQNADELTPDVMQAAKSANSASYNALFDRNSVQLNAGTWQKLGQIGKQADQDLPPDQAQIVRNQIQKYVDAAGANNGQIPGRLYQSVRQTVQHVEGQNQPSKYLVGQVRKTMQDAANNSFQGNDAQALQALNGQFSNLKILGKALGQAQGANYSVSPANLWRLANTKYGATPEMTDLAQLGQTVLKDPVANSGTAQRELAYRYLLGGDVPLAFMNPHAAAALAAPAAAGMTVGRMLNSPLAARALPYAGQNMLLGLSRAATPAPYLAPALAPYLGSIVTGQQ